MRFRKYQSSQALDEGFVPQEDPGREIFYRTVDWGRYKEFKKHVGGEISTAQGRRYDRHAAEIIKLLRNSEEILSLGGGTGSLEKRLFKLNPSLKFTVSDIYHRETAQDINFLLLDMTDLDALTKALYGFDTVLIVNAISPLYPNELTKMIDVIARSDVKSVVVYSAEDLRLVNAIFGFLKNIIHWLIKKKSMWIGYLYNSTYVSSLLKSRGFERTCFEISREKGFMAPIWGNAYVAKFSRGHNDHDDDKIEIRADNLVM